MTDEKRPYRMKARAELQQATRRRIAESAVALHGTLGPSRTTMSAVAEHAGVRRSTLYRHFPDEAALFEACSGLWMSQHPLPALDRWAAVTDPNERLRRALRELYAYYAEVEAMLSNLFRDLDTVESVQRQFAQFLGYMQAAHTTLLADRGEPGNQGRTARAAIGHALSFTTWRSLVREQGCTAKQAVEMMCQLAGARTTTDTKDGA
jgi:AcrR family transcriptional regulator